MKKIINDGKSELWRNAAQEVVKDVAQKNQFVVSDMVVTALEQRGLGLSNYSPLGGVFTRAAKDGIISKTDEKQHSTRGKSHSAKTVWVSHIYGPQDVSPESRTLTMLLMHSLSYNAAVVSYASTIYRAGGLDQKTAKKSVLEFRRMQRVYVKRGDEIVAEYEKKVGGQTSGN